MDIKSNEFQIGLIDASACGSAIGISFCINVSADKIWVYEEKITKDINIKLIN